MSSIKIRAKSSGDEITVKALMKHPMETGQRKDSKTGDLIPAHYITEVVCEHNGSPAFTAYWGPSVSKNPYLSFKIKGGAIGDTVKISWVDNKGNSDSDEAQVT